MIIPKLKNPELQNKYIFKEKRKTRPPAENEKSKGDQKVKNCNVRAKF